MPTRTQTAKRPGEGRFARTTGKPAQRPAGGRRVGSAARPTIVRRRQPEKSGAAKVVDKLAGTLPGRRGKKSKRGAAGGRSKKGTAGLALLAGAAGLVMKNRDRLTSMLHRGDSSNEAVDRVEPRTVADVPVSPEAPDARPLGSNDQSTT
jgi:hypothetical protein